MRRTLSAWLAYIEQQHPSAIALGLERVAQVRSRMDIVIAAPVFTVAGTNGKGSTCAMLEAILRAAGYRTGLYTSPHLARYNERVRIAGNEAADEALAEAFAAVEHARGDVPLTYFEFGTLAALWLFAREAPDALVLEVGLGGRLDAVNVVDTECAVLTGVAIDHTAYLGDTREAIGAEKAGIFRAGRPAVVADLDPPRSVLAAAERVGARLLLYGRDFDVQAEVQQWRYRGPDGSAAVLAHPALRGSVQLRNAAAAITALQALRARIPVALQDIRNGLAHVELAGRFQALPGRPQVVLDVAHNPEAARALAANLGASGYAPETIAVIGMLRDKDMKGVATALAGRITRWHAASLPGPRGARSEELAAAIAAAGSASPVLRHDSPAQAFAAAKAAAGEGDKIVVCGSFLTVAEVMALADDLSGRLPGHG
ncbi:MAG: bifunctional tetrahydrofolate synthase/dihydrofolate synthase [Betaproteobacteria bacterium]|nr:bifunctional tetrahydrofolate synthase/dihydrofolate synthase [Betaproteobacteria bacterium]